MTLSSYLGMLVGEGGVMGSWGGGGLGGMGGGGVKSLRHDVLFLSNNGRQKKRPSG
jgi:hypothetical protein